MKKRNMAQRDIGVMISLLDQALHDDTKRAKLAAVHDVSKASAASSIAQTEYQDGKVARILTVVAFLSAAIAAVFARFQTVYDWRQGLLVDAAYGLFFAYVVIVGCAAGWLIYAIRPTFNTPKEWTGEPGSLFFFEQIIESKPSDWATYWIDKSEEFMKARAAADYIRESYFVAEKVELKLERVRIGLCGIYLAMGALVLFFIAAGLIFASGGPAIVPVPVVIVSPSPSPRPTTNATPQATPSSRP